MDFWHLSNTEWFDILDEDAKRTLNEAADEIVAQKGEQIFAPEPNPRYTYLLLDGLVSIFRMTQDGDRLIMAIVRPGQVFGELAIVGDAPRETHATAVKDARILRVPRKSFMDVLQSSSPANLYITKLIASESIKFQRRLESLVFRSVRARMAGVLCELAEDFGQERGGHVLIDVQLTQTEFAQLIGASRPSVNIAFKEFEEDGELVRTREGITILDLASLTLIAREDLPRRQMRATA